MCPWPNLPGPCIVCWPPGLREPQPLSPFLSELPQKASFPIKKTKVIFVVNQNNNCMNFINWFGASYLQMLPTYIKCKVHGCRLRYSRYTGCYQVLLLASYYHSTVSLIFTAYNTFARSFSRSNSSIFCSTILCCSCSIFALCISTRSRSNRRMGSEEAMSRAVFPLYMYDD